MSLISTVRYIVGHPLSRHRTFRNLGNFASWQIRSRLASGPISIAFTAEARLFAQRGMTSATGHVYVGLQEFEDMSFVIHALRPGDWFADVGANIGAYTVLAGAVAGANVVAFEPGEEARGWLEKNVAQNNIASQVEVYAQAVGNKTGSVKFSIGLDTTNSVIASGDKTSISHEGTVNVPMTRLDDVCAARCPTVIKIDVEGFETPVIEGSHSILQRPTLLALVIEMNGSGAKYGYDETKLSETLQSYGFEPFEYRPFDRRLAPLEGHSSRVSDNVIFARNLGELDRRLRQATPFGVNGWKI